tara:strand:+ start:102 stop:260 length:159 start_codon:yes stop_codon:yes gene_type:complete
MDKKKKTCNCNNDIALVAEFIFEKSLLGISVGCSFISSLILIYFGGLDTAKM